MMSTVNLKPSGVLQLCPGSNVMLVCTNNQSSVLAWRAFDENNHPEGDPCFFSDQSKIDMIECTSGSFTILLISTSPLVSTATLKNKFDPQQNGTILVCSSTVSPNPSPSQMENAILTIKGTLYMYVLARTCSCLFAYKCTHGLHALSSLLLMELCIQLYFTHTHTHTHNE